MPIIQNNLYIDRAGVRQTDPIYVLSKTIWLQEESVMFLNISWIFIQGYEQSGKQEEFRCFPIRENGF